MITLIAALLVLLALVNTYFVWHGAVLFLRDPQHSPILLSLLTTKAVIWGLGLYFAIPSATYLLEPKPVSNYGAAVFFGLLLIGVECVPGFIHWQVERIERSRE